MKTELFNLEDGTVKIEVCMDGFCESGWVSSHHLVPTKEAQLKEVILAKAKEAFTE